MSYARSRKNRSWMVRLWDFIDWKIDLFREWLWNVFWSLVRWFFIIVVITWLILAVVVKGIEALEHDLQTIKRSSQPHLANR